MGWNYLSIPKLQRLHRWSLGMDRQFHSTLYNGCYYLSMLGLKLNHVSKRGHRSPEISKLREKRLYMSNRPVIWQTLRQHYHLENNCQFVKLQSDTIYVAKNLVWTWQNIADAIFKAISSMKLLTRVHWRYDTMGWGDCTHIVQDCFNATGVITLLWGSITSQITGN